MSGQSASLNRINIPMRQRDSSSGSSRSKSRTSSKGKNRTRSHSPGSKTNSKFPLPFNVGLEDKTHHQDYSSSEFMVEVKLLSDEEAPLQIELTNTCLGRSLFNQVIERLDGIVTKEYFGLRFLDRNKQRQWLEMSKTVYKQLKNVVPRTLNFRIKHYPSDPLAEFRQEKARYLLYLQLRRDLHSGRLIGRNVEMHTLAACILQAEVGDYEVLMDYLGDDGNLVDLKMFANVTPRTEMKIREIHKSLKGLTVEEAENKFLEHASKFETYGIEPLYVQDRKGNHFYMGLNHEGVVTFRGSRKAHVFSWKKINKISYDGKLFIIQVEWEQKRHTLGFKCPTSDAAEALWKWAVDRQCFFTLNRSVDAKESKANGGIFKRRQFYAFTGRCQKELMLLNSSLPTIPQPAVSRSHSLLNLAKTVQQTRQSKSHNDLAERFGEKENVSTEEMRGSNGTSLQRHMSVLDTRNENKAQIDTVTNQLGNQVLGTHYNKTVPNSQSTPSLVQNQNGEELENRLATPTTNPMEGYVDVPEKNEIPKADGTENALNNTQQAADKADTHVDEPKMPVTDEVTSESEEESDLEEHAQAAEYPLDANNRQPHAGSVNTLSSSPFHSTDDEKEHESEQENVKSGPIFSPRKRSPLNYLGTLGMNTIEEKSHSDDVTYSERSETHNSHVTSINSSGKTGGTSESKSIKFSEAQKEPQSNALQPRTDSLSERRVLANFTHESVDFIDASDKSTSSLSHHTTLNDQSTKQSIYFPYAKSINKTLPRVPAIKFDRLRDTIPPAKVTEDDRPKEINLSAENFSYAPNFTHVRLISPRPFTISHPESKTLLSTPLEQRKVDLSPEPRDWFQSTTTPRLQTTGIYSDIEELLVKPEPKEEILVPKTFVPCGSNDNTLPPKSNKLQTERLPRPGDVRLGINGTSYQKYTHNITCDMAAKIGTGSLERNTDFLMKKLEVQSISGPLQRPYQSTMEKHVAFESPATPNPITPDTRSELPEYLSFLNRSTTTSKLPSPLPTPSSPPAEKHPSTPFVVNDSQRISTMSTPCSTVDCQVQTNHQPDTPPDTEETSFCTLMRQIFYLLVVAYVVLKIYGWIHNLSRS